MVGVEDGNEEEEDDENNCCGHGRVVAVEFEVYMVCGHYFDY